MNDGMWFSYILGPDADGIFDFFCKPGSCAGVWPTQCLHFLVCTSAVFDTAGCSGEGVYDQEISGGLGRLNGWQISGLAPSSELSQRTRLNISGCQIWDNATGDRTLEVAIGERVGERVV